MRSLNLAEFNHYLKNSLPEEHESVRESLIRFFRENKYSDYIPVSAVLYKLKAYAQNNPEVHYHLFRHLNALRLPEAALSEIMVIMDKREFIKSMIEDYPVAEDREAEPMLISGDTDNITRHIMGRTKGNRKTTARNYQRIASYLINIDLSKSMEMFNYAVKYSNPAIIGRIVLKYADNLLTESYRNNAIHVLQHFVGRDNASAPIAYKLALLLEDQKPQEALKLYRSIKDQQGDYLDVEERINSLTNNENKCKINNQDNNNIDFT